MRNRISILVLGAILAFSLVGCANKVDNSKSTTASVEKKVVKLGYPGAANFMGGLAGIAQEKKLFDEELQKIGYTIEYIPFAAAGPAVNEALASKSIDFAIYADFPGVVLKSKGVGIDLLGITDNRTHATMIVKSDSKISSVKDLKGKKIGFTKGTYMQKFLWEVLAKNGLSEKDVQLINITTEAEASLISGNIDAAVLTDTQALQLTAVKKIAKNLVSTRDYPELAAQIVFVGSNDYAKANEEAVVAMHKALIRAKDYAKKNIDDTYQILTRTGLSIEAVKEQYKGVAPEFGTFTIKTTDNSIKRLEVTQKFLLDQKLINNSYETAKWADNSYYEKAVK